MQHAGESNPTPRGSRSFAELLKVLFATRRLRSSRPTLSTSPACRFMPFVLAGRPRGSSRSRAVGAVKRPGQRRASEPEPLWDVRKIETRSADSVENRVIPGG